MAGAGSRRIEDRLARRGGVIELLRVPAALFGAVAGLRGALYDRGWLPSDRLDLPVVSVGNLTAGGTGKTPMVAWLVRAFRQRGLRPGIVSRGYGAQAGEDNDEARALAAEFPDVPHVLDPDRARGARSLEGRADVIVLDDAFQHRRLARDLDLVLVDATRPWGLAPEPGATTSEAVGAFLPRGLLREAPRALARAHAVVLTRTDQVAPEELRRIEQRIAAEAPGVPVLHAVHRPARLRRAAGETLEAEALAGRTVDLVSGIGNPAAFEASAKALGASVAEHRRFPDHHAFAAGDLDGLGADGRWVVTTAKDAVKLGAAEVDLAVLEIELELTSGAPVLEALLDALPPGRALRERRALHEGLHG